MLSRSLGISFLLACLSTTALAAPIASDAVPDSQLLEHNGVAGMWFSIPKARQLLKDVTAAHGTQRELELVNQRLHIEQETSRLLTKQVQVSDQIAGTWRSTAESQAKLLAAKQAWWRHPYLWTAVGLVIGTSTTIGLTYAVRNVSK